MSAKPKKQGRAGRAREKPNRKARRHVPKDASGGAPARRVPRGGPKDESGRAGRDGERLWIYGRHAAAAALANRHRKIRRILASPSALEWLAGLRAPKERLAGLIEADPARFDAALHEGAVHQGIALEVEDLPRARLKEACQPDARASPVVVLDQITDPHNIGAIFRSAAAFGALAVIVQERRTPPLAGALAKAAAGAVEALPCVPVVNIARALEGLKGLGYFCAGLAGEASQPIEALPSDRPTALVLGAEGAGLRHLVRQTCDGLYAIPIARGMESLNVSNAAAVTLYEIARRRAG